MTAPHHTGVAPDIAPPAAPASHHDHTTGHDLAPTHRINLPAEVDPDDSRTEFEPPRVGRVELAFMAWLMRFRFMREKSETLPEKLDWAMNSAVDRPAGLRRSLEILFTRTVGRFGTIVSRWFEWCFFSGSFVRCLIAVAGHGIALALLNTIPPVHSAAVWLVQVAWWLVNAGEPVVD